MDHSIAIPALVAFFITLILGPGLISFLHKLKFGQFIREEGPESHLKKSGTPTMGGIMARTEVKEAEVSKSEMLKI